MACIPPTLKGWVYIIPIHGPLDGPLYTCAQYTPTDLRDKVRDLTRENTNLRGSISESGAELDQMIMKGRQVEQSLLLKLA